MADLDLQKLIDMPGYGKAHVEVAKAGGFDDFMARAWFVEMIEADLDMKVTEDQRRDLYKSIELYWEETA